MYAGVRHCNVDDSLALYKKGEILSLLQSATKQLEGEDDSSGTRRKALQLSDAMM